MAVSFTTLSGAAAPYLEENVSTNVISVQKPHGHDPATADPRDELLSGLRFDESGIEHPEFVLNRPEFREAKFLIAGANFGCASSRENAVIALSNFGIRCVIAPSTGDIFFNNCFKFGVLPVILPQDEVLALAAEAMPGAPSAIFSADLEKNELVTPSGRTLAIPLPAFRRQQLLEGLNEVELTLQRASDIESFHRSAAGQQPWMYDLGIK
ncbi:MAG: 3-isopropylmalate dehydratase small subunit [Rhodospirillaceae bacterium]|jgi:3-isopropylmalate/(R)-2-methylmalate dehydratase small subunit|nr:3-isopropylmalate dehydratase small subunit [Rhodospirillaceae bacterium]